jgi:galactonate dehydratase
VGGIAPHNVGGVISTSAALHLMAGLRNGKILEHFNDFSDVEIQKAGAPYPDVREGCFALVRGAAVADRATDS